MTACSSAADRAEEASTSTATSAPSTAAPSPAAPSPSAPAALPSLPAADESASPLPEGWPSGLPGYEGGTIISAVVSEDGSAINAVWSTQESADDAWAAMEAALRAAGFQTSGEAGGADMLIEDDTMRNDVFVADGLEANVIVLDGEQVSVLLNASVLP